MDWDDICIAYDENRVRCIGCGEPVRQTFKCSCGHGKATPVPSGVGFVWSERDG